MRLILLALCFILWSIRIHPQLPATVPCHRDSHSALPHPLRCLPHLQPLPSFPFPSSVKCTCKFITILRSHMRCWLVNRLLRRKVRTAIEGLATIFDLPARRCVSPPLSLPLSHTVCGKCLCIKNRLWLCSAQIEQSINPNLLTV